jgi:hypothetical protein
LHAADVKYPAKVLREKNRAHIHKTFLRRNVFLTDFRRKLSKVAIPQMLLEMFLCFSLSKILEHKVIVNVVNSKKIRAVSGKHN